MSAFDALGEFRSLALILSAHSAGKEDSDLRAGERLFFVFG